MGVKHTQLSLPLTPSEESYIRETRPFSIYTLPRYVCRECSMTTYEYEYDSFQICFHERCCSYWKEEDEFDNFKAKLDQLVRERKRAGLLCN